MGKAILALMITRFIGQFLFVTCLLFCGSGVMGQTPIFGEQFNEGNGATSGQDDVGFTPWTIFCDGCDVGKGFRVVGSAIEARDVDGMTEFRTDPIDISKCSQIRVSMDYDATSYVTGGETLDEHTQCPAAGGGCPGDPSTPDIPLCANCWDFSLVELFYDFGGPERLALFGRGVNPAGSVTIDETSRCVGDATEVTLVIKAQTNLPAEFIQFSNIMMVCIEPDFAGIPFSAKAEYCDGETVDFSITSTSGASYDWFLNDLPIGSNSPNLSFAANEMLGANQRIEYITTLATGCKETGGKNILVNSAPSVSLAPATSTVCEGAPINLEASSAAVATTWEWTTPGTATSTTNMLDIPASVLADRGAYGVTVTDATGCMGSAFATVRVEAVGSITLDSVPDLCVTDGPFILPDMVDGISGQWSNLGGISPGTNTFTPANVSPGTHILTFTPGGAGCTSAVDTTVRVWAVPASFPFSGPLEICGTTATAYDLTTRNSEITGGAIDTVRWFEDPGLTQGIMDSTEYVPGVSTVYAVIEQGACFSAPQALDLVLTTGPEITMPDTIRGCSSVTLNPISISNGSGNEAYYSESGGMGVVIPVGTIFTGDTVVYAYDNQGACEAQQEITIIVVEPLSAGMDRNVLICESGFIDLLAYVDPAADAGGFQNALGDPIADNMIVAQDLIGANIRLVYEVGNTTCPIDQAEYFLSIRAGNDAGRDSTVQVCHNSVIDLMTLTTDNGVAGVFQSLAGEVLSSPDTIASITNSTIEFNYIVNAGSCPADTAAIVILTESQDVRLIEGEYCHDAEIPIGGDLYHSGNTKGSYTVPSAGFCDSLITIDLIFRPENRVTIIREACVGDIVTVNSIQYTSDFMGVVQVAGGDRYGCDSILEIDISFVTEITTLLDFIVCEGQDTLINGKTYSESDNTGSATLVSSNGCDSIVVVDLNFAQGSESTLSGVYCPADTIMVEGEIFDINRQKGRVVSQFPNRDGCDSTIIVDLEFDSSNLELITFALCSNLSVDIFGVMYGAGNPSGTHVVPTAGACDSVYFIDLNIFKADTILISETFCIDTSITVNNVVYDRFMSEGEEVIIGGSVSGCNQYIIIDLEYIESYIDTIDAELCYDGFIEVNKTIYDRENSSGIEELKTAAGCDSVIIVDLSFSGVDASFIEEMAGCSEEGGRLIIEILEGSEFVQDVLIDGMSIYASGQVSFLAEDLAEGDHEANVISDDGCSISYAFTVEELGEESLSILSEVIQELYYQLNIDFSGEISSLLWTPSDGLSCVDCENPEARPKNATSYSVTIEDGNGCVYTESIDLSLLVSSVIYKPTAFSPNSDGVNDVFFLNSEGSYDFTNFFIFDRWGNQVFRKIQGKTGNPDDGWNGEGHNPGVFIFVLELVFPDGVKTLSGEFSLMR